jgi:hypothetical protein
MSWSHNRYVAEYYLGTIIGDLGGTGQYFWGNQPVLEIEGQLLRKAATPEHSGVEHNDIKALKALLSERLLPLPGFPLHRIESFLGLGEQPLLSRIASSRWGYFHFQAFHFIG